MKQLDPNHIPETISLVASIFSEKRNPTKEEFLKLDNFFKIYMGKAIEDCQKQSAALWSPLKPKSELNFSSKEVVSLLLQLQEVLFLMKKIEIFFKLKLKKK